MTSARTTGLWYARLSHPSSRLAWVCSCRGGRSPREEAETPKHLNQPLLASSFLLLHWPEQVGVGEQYIKLWIQRDVTNWDRKCDQSTTLTREHYTFHYSPAFCPFLCKELKSLEQTENLGVLPQVWVAVLLRNMRLDLGGTGM